ncbi:MAG: tetratricopeptide repeat protein [Prolixibacteraceae bacterium]|nr:tetratricopeptide repeat protein [Prolixibacteraceae bacterium]
MTWKFLISTILACIGLAVSAQNLPDILRKAYSSRDSSDFYFQQALKLIKSPADQAEYYFCKAARATDYGEPDSAIHYGNQASEKFIELRDTSKLIYVYNNLSKIYQKKGSYEKAISTLFEGLKLAERRHDNLWMGFLYQNIALNYHDFEDYEKGVKYGKLALARLLASEKAKAYNLALALNTIAINFDDWNQPDSALNYHFRIFKYKNDLDTLRIGFTYNNIGNTLLKQNRYAEARNWVERSIAITRLNKEQMGDIPFSYELATNFTNLATIYSKLAEYRKAEASFDSAYAYTTKSNSIEKLRDYHYQQFQHNKQRGNLERALFFQEEYFKIRDQIFSDTRAKSIAELETKYETAKKEKELAETHAQMLIIENKEKQKSLWLILISVLTGFIVVVSYLIYKQQKLKLVQQEQEFRLQEEIARMDSQNKLQEQRLSISRDLHDNIGSQLTFIISLVNNLKFSHKTENSAILNQLNRIGDFAGETITELRDTIWAINSTRFTFEDLRARILNFIEKARHARPNLTIKFNLAPELNDLELSAVAGINIYRTIQEAVNNSMKYAETELITIEVIALNHNVEIIVQDKGKGFDIDSVQKGNGLYNMQKRVEDLGGEIQLSSGTGKGTSVKLILKKQQITSSKTLA